MEDVLLKILEWLRVVIENRDSIKAAWELIHPFLKDHLDAKWLNIINLAIKGLNKEALAALDALEVKIRGLFKSNKELMEKIRKLEDPDILKAVVVGVATGAAVGGGGGVFAGGPVGATFGAVVGGTVGGAGAFIYAGYHAVKKYITM